MTTPSASHTLIMVLFIKQTTWQEWLVMTKFGLLLLAWLMALGRLIRSFFQVEVSFGQMVRYFLTLVVVGYLLGFWFAPPFHWNWMLNFVKKT